MSAASDQKQILQYLYNRLAGGDVRYCTIPTIRKNTEVEASNQYILALTDDLESNGLVITRQAYQISGGRLFQITASGIDAIDNNKLPVLADSAAWTGRFYLSDNQKGQIRQILHQMRAVVSGAKLSNARTANAMALIEAVEKLVETPDPLWPEIMRLLRSPTLAGIAGIAGLVLSVVQILMAAASS
jgi:DNA-binding PadR family transcriptional regulator